MFNLAFIPVRLLPYVLVGAGAVIGVAGTLLTEHRLLPWLTKEDEADGKKAGA
jgi:hypothetical protein